MKGFLKAIAVLSVLLIASSAGATGSFYTWTISGSATDPYQNTVPFVQGLRTIYLWYACSTPEPEGPGGAAAAEFGLYSVDLANSIVGFVPTAGFLNAGTATEPLLAIANCPAGPRRAANLLILSATPTQWCFRPSAANGIIGTVDCSSNPQLWAIDWFGLDDGLGLLCFEGTGDCQKPIAVEPTSWGQVKALYR